MNASDFFQQLSSSVMLCTKVALFERPVSDNHDLVARIESRHGLHQLTYMTELEMGSPVYDLINIDD